MRFLAISAFLLASGAALAANLPTHKPAPPTQSCALGAVPATAGPDGASAPFEMRLVARGASHDGSGIWTDFELMDPFARAGTDIYEARVTTCAGAAFVVSQIVNRQCSSASDCPIRVVNQDSRTPISYKQACTNHRDYYISGDAGTLWACNVEYPLASR